MMQRRKHHYNEAGFTMVVIAALFIAFAVIAAVAVERNTTVQQITRRDATVEQLTRLSNAIIEFSVFNKSGSTLLYPCPAVMNMLTTDASGTFGKAITNCYTGAAPAGVTQTGGANTDVFIGLVPVLDLSQYGIGINDAFDPWNNRILYVVNRKLTVGGSPSMPLDQGQNPTLNAISPASTPPRPDFILISLGRDGAGGVKRDSTTVSITCPGSNNRSENCNGDFTFITGPTYITVSGTAANMSSSYFDDILTWYRQ